MKRIETEYYLRVRKVAERRDSKHERRSWSKGAEVEIKGSGWVLARKSIWK